MYDLASIGDITIDLFFRDETLTRQADRFSLAVGGKYAVSYFHESLGGGGANVAAGAAHFGLKTAVMGKIGENAFKQMIVQKLIKKTVACEFLTIEKDYVNLSAILLTTDGERTIIHYCPPHKGLPSSEGMFDKAFNTRAVYMGNLPYTSPAARKKLLAGFKKRGALVCLNFGVSDCRNRNPHLEDLISQCDVLILNTHEYAELVKKKKETLDFSQNCADRINLEAKILILTDGPGGSYLYHQNKVHFQPAIAPAKIVDTTGAGDAYVSGFLADYLTNKDLPKAMRQGASYAAQIIGRVGAQ